ncbi:MAG TPA: histidine kinase dimerization/phospho-acceptor domain-containing protein, partial [Candidatus Dormibacteraeota bacterium]|nr:histidine kinase dimerization/phospho-acceptor domain-containing protein [Candidatus Dormibacteraeota bacterium]
MSRAAEGSPPDPTRVGSGEGRTTADIPADLADRVLAAIADAVVVIDREGRITCWSGSSEQLFGVPAERAVGRPLIELFPALVRNDPIELSTLGGAERLEAVQRLGDAGPFIAVTTTPLRDERGAIVGTTALTRLMGGWLDPVERAGRPKRQWHRTLGGIVQDLAEEAVSDPTAMDASEALARMLVGQARRLLPGAECLLAVVPRDRQERFRVVAGAGPWAERQVGTEWPRTGTLAGRALQEGRALESTRLRELGEPIEAIVAGGMRAGRLVPLSSARPLPDGRQALGVLAFYRPTRLYFTPYERRLIGEFARLVTLSLQRAELLRSAAEAASRLRTGVNVAIELAVTLDPNEVIGKLVRQAAASVDAERVALMEIEGHEAVVVESFDRSGSLQSAPAGARFAISELLSGDEPVMLRAVSDGQPKISGAYRVRGVKSVTEWGQAGPRHTLTLPLVLGGSVMAVLLVSRMHDRPFRREDALTAQLVGNVAVLALRNARLFAEAQEANRARSDFLNMAGHELRTPLTVIKGYLSMLSDGSLGEAPEGLRQPIELLAAKAEELSSLVDDLLFTSRLDAGRLPAHPMRLDLRIAVQDAARRAEPRVQLLGGELVVAAGDEPLVVSADPEHVARVLDNLV